MSNCDESLRTWCRRLTYIRRKIGVLFPKREQGTAFEEFVAANPIPGADESLWVDTLHGAKGWEFRAVHIGGSEALYRMGANSEAVDLHGTTSR